MTKEQVAQKIKEIISKDKNFDSTTIVIKFTDKKIIKKDKHNE